MLKTPYETDAQRGGRAASRGNSLACIKLVDSGPIAFGTVTIRRRERYTSVRHALPAALHCVRAALPIVFLLAIAAGAWTCAAAAEAPGKAPAKTAAATKGKKADKPEIPAPEEVRLSTQDGVQLAATYYPGWKGKESVPVLLLHQYKGSRRDYTELAKALHEKGCAVLAFDFRGHGDSTSQRVGNRSETLDAAKLSPAQFLAMVRYDLQAAKEYLWKRHNEGDFNLNRLCVVGGEMGASVAVDFANEDWNIRNYGPIQLGGFVKGLVLLSPQYQFRNLSMRSALAPLSERLPLSLLVVAGQDDAHAVEEAKRIFGIFERARHESPGEAKEDSPRRSIYYIPVNTKLQGTALLTAPLNVPKFIAKFIDLRLAGDGAKDIEAWKQLKLPHE